MVLVSWASGQPHVDRTSSPQTNLHGIRKKGPLLKIVYKRPSMFRASPWDPAHGGSSCPRPAQSPGLAKSDLRGSLLSCKAIQPVG